MGSFWYCRKLALILATVTLSSMFALVSILPDHAADVKRMITLDESMDPVAIIDPLDDVVSKGSWGVLNGANSYDPNGGIITNTTWMITYQGTYDFNYSPSFQYKFQELGLYKIQLTVTNELGFKGTNFTAVISVIDYDYDDLPDWWEMTYFDDLSQNASGDPDGDGFDNLQEYATGTDPMVFDETTPPSFFEKYWAYLAGSAAVAIAIFAILYPRHRRMRKETERKKIEYAIEIEKSLEEEE